MSVQQNPSCLENKKKVKSDHSRSSRYTEKCNILVQRADSNIRSSKIPIPSRKNDAEGQSEVYGSDIGCPGELGSSTRQSSSCTSSVSDEISIDACSLEQLQHVMMQLDTRTKLCIRNSLYRLARSAAQRHNCVSPSRAQGESKDTIDALLSDGTNKPEELNPKTNAPLDNPTRERGCLSLTNEIEYKILSDKARKALAYYNKTNKGEEFEFIEIEKFEAVYHFPYWINHMTFMAKPKGKPDSRPKLFFAEVYERLLNFGKYEVKMCMTMDPSGPDVEKGCVYTKSDKDMLHPKGVNFFAGPPGGYSTME